MAKSCGGHIQSIPHVIQAVANLSSYSLGSQSASILYGDSSPQLLLDFEIKCDTVLGKGQLYRVQYPVPGYSTDGSLARYPGREIQYSTTVPGTRVQ